MSGSDPIKIVAIAKSARSFESQNECQSTEAACQTWQPDTNTRIASAAETVRTVPSSLRTIPSAECTGRVVRSSGGTNPDRLWQVYFLRGGLWGKRCLRHREHVVAPARQLTP